jgi:hypothetical protein
LFDNRRRADICAVMGSSGAGKSATVCKALAGVSSCPRLMIYDPGEDYSQFGEVFSARQDFFNYLAKTGAATFRAVFRPLPELEEEVLRSEFNWFCRVAMAVCRGHGETLIVVDELEDVVTASWAPPWWKQLIRKGRKIGARVIAASQRPAGIQKHFWSLATEIQSGRLNEIEDARTVARVLMVEPLEIVALEPLQWIRRSVYRPVIVRGHIEWRDGRPVDAGVTEKNIELFRPS